MKDLVAVALAAAVFLAAGWEVERRYEPATFTERLIGYYLIGGDIIVSAAGRDASRIHPRRMLEQFPD